MGGDLQHLGDNDGSNVQAPALFGPLVGLEDAGV